MDPNQAEGVMKELEGAMNGMDDENPDPRQMGQLMRKMCEITGERMDEPMEEVVRKLEEGMDPDALEERMGNFWEMMDWMKGLVLTPALVKKRKPNSEV